MEENMSLEPRYSIDEEERYATRCFYCAFRIDFEDYAERMEDCTFWFCSSNCIQAARKARGPRYCWQPEDKNIVTLKDFMQAVEVNYNKKIAAEVSRLLLKIEMSGLTRAEVKQKAEDGDAEFAVIIGLTYQFRFVADRSQSAVTICLSFSKSSIFSKGKAIKYMKIAEELDNPIAVYGLVLMSQLGAYNGRTWKDYVYRAHCYYPDDHKLFVLFGQEWQSEIDHEGVINNVLLCRGVTSLLYFKDQTSCLTPKYSSFLGSDRLVKLVQEVEIRKLKFRHMVFQHTSVPTEELYTVHPTPLNAEYRNRSGEVVIGTERDWKGVHKDMDPSLMARQPIYICVHSSSKKNKNEKLFLNPGNDCMECIMNAWARVLAVYQNTFWLSEYEVNNHFYSAIYPSYYSIAFQEEIFFNYSKCEVIFALKYLSRFPEELRVLQIAKCPHFYWPIIHYFGSIYNALLVTLGVEFTMGIYASYPTDLPRTPPIARVDMYPPDRTDRLVLKCGSAFCNKLDLEFQFSQCRRCKIRRYCSDGCQAKDWKRHKPNCYLRKRTIAEDKEENGELEEEDVVDAVENLQIEDPEEKEKKPAWTTKQKKKKKK